MSDNKKVKPQNPKGTRDFLPQQVAKRNFIFSTIKSVFRQYGFEEIETPAFERLETLTGKYGDEGDKLLFKILNSGNPFAGLDDEAIASLDSEMWKDFKAKHGFTGMTETQLNEEINNSRRRAATLLSEKGLRYDLTVPLARYVVQHQSEIVFPFRRYHIGPVWRADRPQKGRYQEFYQCDADIIGSTSLINEVELTQIYVEVFERLGIEVTIKVNNRKVLESIARWFQLEIEKASETLTESERRGLVIAVTLIVVVALLHSSLDKIDKIGYDEAKEEIKRKGIPEIAVNKLDDIFKVQGDNYVQLSQIKALFLKANVSVEGIDEVEYLLKHFRTTDARIVFSSFLARGLDYYTGMIWEVTANGVQMGSIGGGGRYDNLTEMFGGQGMSGVGISFGIERIYDVMEELNLFPENIAQGVTILFVPRDASNEEYAFKLATIARTEGISAEVFLGKAKKNKHFGYAATKGINYMVEVGDNEQQSRHFRLRNVAEHKEEGTGFSLEELMQHLKK